MTKYVTSVHQLHYAVDGDQKVIQPGTVFDAAIVEQAGFPAGSYRDATDGETALYERTEGLNAPKAETPKAPTAAEKKAAAAAAEAERVAAEAAEAERVAAEKAAAGDVIA